MNLGRWVLDSVERLQEPESLRLEVELKLMEGPLTDVIGAVRRTLSNEKNGRFSVGSFSRPQITIALHEKLLDQNRYLKSLIYRQDSFFSSFNEDYEK